MIGILVFAWKMSYMYFQNDKLILIKIFGILLQVCATDLLATMTNTLEKRQREGFATAGQFVLPWISTLNSISTLLHGVDLADEVHDCQATKLNSRIGNSTFAWGMH